MYREGGSCRRNSVGNGTGSGAELFWVFLGGKVYLKGYNQSSLLTSHFQGLWRNGGEDGEKRESHLEITEGWLGEG